MRAVASSPDAVERLLAGYRCEAGAYDELKNPAGEIRPHQASWVHSLAGLGAEELRRRAETSRRFVEERGIHCGVQNGNRDPETNWSLDPIPLVLSPKDFSTLEEGLVQRAHLLNKVLADCYGLQRLVRTKYLPPALIFAHPLFLRPCRGVGLPRNAYLHFYAADVARGPDGNWWVLSDRTQTPAGAGYALANRLITSRVLPETFRAQPVHRLAGFFKDRRDSLATLSPRSGVEPSVVLLTPGEDSETHSEQAHLARYMGYPLVAGSDLTVRDDRVFLKTLSGLDPVDVIVRRVGDLMCDPLELRNDSVLGVPGLLQAVRAGKVVLANALGAGLVEAPGFLEFLPGLCREILGEDLKLPSVATWWCGRGEGAQYALDHLDEVTVQNAFRVRPESDGSPSDLSAAERGALAARIRFRPERFVARGRITPSLAPCWDGARIQARPIVLRMFLVASGGSYKVMPGGLTRVSETATLNAVTMRHGWTSKDTWVVSDKPVEQVSLIHAPGSRVELRRVGNNLPSRLADNFFWLGRYTERAGATARLLRSALVRLSPEQSSDFGALLDPLLRVLETQGQLSRNRARRGADVLETALRGAIFDPQRPDSLRNIVSSLQRLARQVRDRTSSDVWRAFSQIDDPLTESDHRWMLLGGDVVRLLNTMLLHIAALQGLAREHMTRAQGWRFLDIGCRLERALYSALFIERSLRSPQADNPSALELVLEIADSSITYRSRYSLIPNIAAVCDLVLLDDTNPRSLLFQFNQLAKHYERLPRDRSRVVVDPVERILIECIARLRLLDAQELMGLEGRWRESEVARVLRYVLRALPRLSDAIAVGYFAHSSISRTGGSLTP